MRVLHTADWQLGLPRHQLEPEARNRYTADRFEAVRALVRLAAEEGCDALVVAGDVFESNQVDRRTVLRALDALAVPSGGSPVPVFLLPANHDPLEAASVWRSEAFRRNRPDHVHVLEDSRPVRVAPDLEVVGVPWRSKRPGKDLVAEMIEGLEPSPGVVRVAVAHGAVDALSPDRRDPARIGLEPVREALEAGLVHYLALGDRHSVTEVEERVWYSGTPEVTDFNEERPGFALVVDVDEEGCEVTEHAVGRWRFVEEELHLSGAGAVEEVRAWLDGQPDKDRTVLRLALVGELSLAASAELEGLLEDAGARFATLRERHRDLLVAPGSFEGGDLERGDLQLSGFARQALESLLAAAEEDPEARDALVLLHRLAGRVGSEEGAAG